MNDQLYSSWQLHGYGIDYITATIPVARLGWFDEAITQYKASEGLPADDKGKAASMRDFAGRKYGKLFLGMNKTHIIIDIKSFVSWSTFLAIACVPDVNVTRIDIQMTGWELEHGADLGKHFHDTMIEYKERKCFDSRLHVEARMNEGKMGTVYLGRPTSSKRLRVYNKTLQAKLDTGDTTLWRVEMQLRDELANNCAYGLMLDTDAPHRVLEFVNGLLRGWNIVINDQMPATPLKYHGSGGESSMDKKFTWWMTQVKPTIEKLLADETYHRPMREELIEILRPYMNG